MSDQVLLERVLAAIRIVLLGVTAVLQTAMAGPVLFGNRSGYHPVWLGEAAFAVLALVIAVSSGWILRGRRVPAGVALPGAAVVLAAAAAAATTVPPEWYLLRQHWAFGLVGWHLLVLLLERTRPLLAAFALHAALGGAQFLLAVPLDRIWLGETAIAIVSVLGFQLAVGLIVQLVTRRLGQMAAIVAARDRAATRAALAEQWEHDQRTRFAGQLGALLPLLAGLADRTLDPRTDDVRHRCALAAARLRRLFAENDDVPDPLVHEVAAAVEVAERRGVAVSFAVSGEVVPVPTAVRRELAEPVLTALSAARTQARVSLLRTAEEVRLAVLADFAVTAGSPSRSPHVEVTAHTHGDRTRMEARWHVTS
ncbi:hypothetical protein GCM10017786_02950 [Amycolatopsis deserti]|uniref:Histidine kinase n=1 Tax=Amycolatopsis deserti TaxID=185696 RepID=A0ABQ3IDR4_9PSEU|nr:hypothetical protein [Amycolatopsis deserti]GHE77064.1 hypothetical protein GCM10017786_02950 [Amycolatopsis deserti]